MIASLIAGALALVAAAALVRLFAGPTLHDRLLAAHFFALCMCVLIAAIGGAVRRAEFIDVAIGVALGEFVALTAAAKFLRYRSFQSALAPRAASDESVRA